MSTFHLRYLLISLLALMLMGFASAPVAYQLPDEALCDIREVEQPPEGFGETGTLILSGFTFLDPKTLQMSTELSHVPSEYTYAQFSPDNTLIAFIQEMGSPVPTAFRQTIFSLKDDEVVSTFAWKPEWLAFAGWVGNELAFLLQDDRIGLELVDLQGVSQRQFTFDEPSFIIPAPYAAPESYPPDYTFFVWAAVNQSLDLVFFVNSRDMEPFSPLVIMNAETGEIYYQASGDESEQLWSRVHLHAPSLGWLKPSWAHQSRQLLVLLSDYNLYLFPVTGEQDPIQVTMEGIRTQRTVLSYDDRYVAFFTPPNNGESGYDALHIIDVESGRSIRLTGFYATSIKWASDSNFLAFYDLGLSNPLEDPQLVVVDVDDCEIWRGSVHPDVTFPNIWGWFKPG